MRVKICRDEDLKDGAARSVKILARNIAVFRIDGVIYGLEADCKHMKANLATGTISGSVVECAMHNWRYDIPTGECLDEEWAKLKTYPAFVEDGYIWVDV